tara:strand:- start:357 stop:866 length:510 start_codon:yes stop_codon:yes gene_type:complete
MEVFECIRGRRTIREYKSDPIPEDVLEKILQAGRWSPSSSNSQPWHFVVVQDPSTLSELGRIATQGSFISDAPLAIVIVMENAPRPQLDAGRAIQQMELVAWSEGLGTCFVGVRIEEQQIAVKELLNIPSDLELITIMPYGYRPTSINRTGTPRKDLADMVHREKFGIH